VGKGTDDALVLGWEKENDGKEDDEEASIAARIRGEAESSGEAVKEIGATEAGENAKRMTMMPVECMVLGNFAHVVRQPWTS